MSPPSSPVSPPSSPDALRGLLLIALAATSWGTTGAVTTILTARAGATPLVIGAVRMSIAAVLLLLAARALAGTLRVAPGDRWRCIAAGVCNAGFQAAYFSAVLLAGIATAALVAICSAPILIAVLAAMLLGERPTRTLLVALALGVSGTALLVAGSSGAEAPPRAGAGIALALVAGLAYALYVVVAKAAVARTAPLPSAAWTFTAAAVVMLPALLDDGAARQIALGWPWLLYLGAVTTAGAYAAYTIGLRLVPAAAAGVAALFEPLTATLLGVAVFGERLGALGWTGAALLIAALLALSPRRSAATPRG